MEKQKRGKSSFLPVSFVRRFETVFPFLCGKPVYMQLTAKLIQLLPPQTGQGKNGPWKKQDIVVETEGQYPKKVCISIWGDKADEKVLKVGNTLKIDFDVESREYNGRWYTDVKAWKVEAAGGTTFDHDAPPFVDEGPVDSENDLPF